jgi:regulation of enolase protein 1 (concanavalin A-like superfamily)
MAIYPGESAGQPRFPVLFPNAWLRLKRTGDEFSAFVSDDGRNWNIYTSHVLHLPHAVLVGLAVTSHSPDAAATAEFRELRITRPARP